MSDTEQGLKMWPKSKGYVRTDVYKSGDTIKITPGFGFQNVKIVGPNIDHVKRVELFVDDLLVATLRSQFHDFTKTLPLIRSSFGDNEPNVFPQIGDKRTRVVLYTEDDLERRHSYSVDIVKVDNTIWSKNYPIEVRNYLALSDEDAKESLRLGGETQFITVRFYGNSESDRTVPTSVIGHYSDGREEPLRQLGPDLWQLDFSNDIVNLTDTKITLKFDGNNVARVEQSSPRGFRINRGSCRFL